MEVDLFEGAVEADETYTGGKESNKHASKRRRAGRGCAGKTAVAGSKDRKTGKVKVRVVVHTDKKTLQGFVQESITLMIYTEEASPIGDFPIINL